MARLLRWLLAAVALAAAAAATGLLLAHREIRSIDPALPDFAALEALAAESDLPTRVSFWNTASQPAPRSSVLEPSRDPDPDQPYVMSHPAFAVEWADGRTLLVDVGMEPEDAVAFGRLIEIAGGGAVVAHGGLAARIGPWLGARPLAIAFTHLHTDHVGGVVALCRAMPDATRVRLLQTGAQVERANFTTRPARALLDAAPCLDRERVADAPVAPLPGLPGAFVIRAAGHTPGSQILGAWVRGPDGVRGHLFAGDAANAIDGIRRDVPKPRAYQTFLVPEWEDRLRRVRAFLREAEQRGFVIAIAHDERHLATTGIPTLAP
jgi:glyoxylase-like metal-dependent hydrolase (beta-lactamase superfamily II)